MPPRDTPEPRAPSGSPLDDYAPYGYLANPHAVARSWSEGEGGNVRSTDDGVGFGWVYPWALASTAGAQIELALEYGGTRLVTREDFQQADLTASHHSSQLFEYAWNLDGLACRAQFVLLGKDELALEFEAGPAPGGSGTGEGTVTLYVAAVAWRRDGEQCSARAADGAPAEILGTVAPGEPFAQHQLLADPDLPARALGAASSLADLVERDGDGDGKPAVGFEGGTAAVGVALPLDVVSGARRAAVVLRRNESARESCPPRLLGQTVHSGVEEARRRDDDFWNGAARLDGDWPPTWRRGWVYDLETTRMCIFPAGGIFTDVWPAWMIQWPRAVLAEASLDVLRLSYAAPHLAKRAALSLFRDAPAPNVPCVFQHGEPNMVAADGTVCGTSPAWCVPFYSLERLYLRTLDNAWLADIYPFLCRYVDWWRSERSDAEGWAVYKCTWEAGEDATPRLDPEERGDNVVSEYIRPVELQATMALSASVLARFADILRRPAEAASWRSVADSFVERAQSLWDPQAGRFRDFDRRAGAFLEPGDQPNYWGIDPRRYSILSLTPLLARLVGAEQTKALSRELTAYAREPWTMWPSWSYVLLESALAAGERAFAAGVANSIVGRVYGELDRRSLGDPRGPTPGVSREYWPPDLSSWRSCEGYGWGATTAWFVVREIFGFLESESTSDLRFRLAPGLPEAFLESGRRYAVLNMPYRGQSLDIEYRVPPTGTSEHSLEVSVQADSLTSCVVLDEGGNAHYASPTAATTHEFNAEVGAMYEVLLRP
jgi:hypothetical protein